MSEHRLIIGMTSVGWVVGKLFPVGCFLFFEPVAKAEGSPPGGMPRERPFFYLTTLFPFSRFEVSLPGPSFRAKNAL